jgi:hypothetical protein
VEIEQVEMTKLLGVTLDCKLSRSKHIDTTVAEMGRSLSITKWRSTFLTTLSTRQVLQALVSTFLTALSTRQVLQALVSTFLTALSTRPVLQALVSTFFTTLSTRKVLQALVLSHLDYCSVMWSSATIKDLGKLQLSQNRAAQLALGCTQRANINNMHVNLSWLKAEERSTSSLLVFVRRIDMLNAPSCPSKLLEGFLLMQAVKLDLKNR